MSERFRMPVFAGLILRRGNDVCLLRRANTKLHDGFYAVAGGGVDGGETVAQANVREASEELGIKLKPEDLKVVHVLHVKTEKGDEYINFFMEANTWQGEPSIMEPHKCDDVAWFTLDQLPSNLMPMHKHVFNMIVHGIVYSEYGWE